RLRHVAEGIAHLADREHAHRKRLDLPGGDALNETRQQRADDGRPLAAQTLEIEGSEGQIVPERAKAEWRVLVDVLLSDLHESSVGCERREAGGDRLAGQRVQDDVNA